jgi:hypothetical protein
MRSKIKEKRLGHYGGLGQNQELDNMGHRKPFQIYFKDLISKPRDLNNSKENLN